MQEKHAFALARYSIILTTCVSLQCLLPLFLRTHFIFALVKRTLATSNNEYPCLETQSESIGWRISILRTKGRNLGFSFTSFHAICTAGHTRRSLMTLLIVFGTTRATMGRFVALAGRQSLDSWSDDLATSHRNKRDVTEHKKRRITEASHLAIRMKRKRSSVKLVVTAERKRGRRRMLIGRRLQPMTTEKSQLKLSALKTEILGVL